MHMRLGQRPHPPLPSRSKARSRLSPTFHSDNLNPPDLVMDLDPVPIRDTAWRLWRAAQRGGSPRRLAWLRLGCVKHHRRGRMAAAGRKPWRSVVRIRRQDLDLGVDPRRWPLISGGCTMRPWHNCRPCIPPPPQRPRSRSRSGVRLRGHQIPLIVFVFICCIVISRGVADVTII